MSDRILFFKLGTLCTRGMLTSLGRGAIVQLAIDRREKRFAGKLS
jgi:hypothetical protein